MGRGMGPRVPMVQFFIFFSKDSVQLNGVKSFPTVKHEEDRCFLVPTFRRRASRARQQRADAHDVPLFRLAALGRRRRRGAVAARRGESG